MTIMVVGIDRIGPFDQRRVCRALIGAGISARILEGYVFAFTSDRERVASIARIASWSTPRVRSLRVDEKELAEAEAETQRLKEQIPKEVLNGAGSPRSRVHA